MSFRVLSGRIFTMLRAGLALNMVSSPVKGLMPLRALVAGLRTTDELHQAWYGVRAGPRPPRLFLI